MKFLDIYNQDHNLFSKIYKDIYKCFKKTNFILGKDVSDFEKIFAKLVPSSLQQSLAAFWELFSYNHSQFEYVSPTIP